MTELALTGDSLDMLGNAIAYAVDMSSTWVAARLMPNQLCLRAA
ncbi:hypothetical protein [Chroococcidiopsis sp. TS-821]|nr:hypothetical protein [Chroococcidiopsis sp. TS-821]